MKESTTPEERAPRIRAIAEALLDAAPEALQELLEHAVRAGGKEGDVAWVSYEAAEDIRETFDPDDAAAFAVGDAVFVSEYSISGKVTARFIDESGGWEYAVQHNGTGEEQPYAERELVAAAASGSRC